MNHKPVHSGVWFDPRTKIAMLIFCVLCATMAPSLLYQLGLVFLISVFGVLCGKWRYAVAGFFAYAVFYVLTVLVLHGDSNTLQATIIAFLGLVHKVYACGFLAGIMISTTKVSEFLSAMNRIHAPKSIVIPLAVMLRYLPTIREDWKFIKDAMRLRDVSPSLKGFFANPGVTVECLYVPFMMSASKAADELSIASVTRGIENPKPRTCLAQIRLRPVDATAVLCLLAYFICGRF